MYYDVEVCYPQPLDFKLSTKWKTKLSKAKLQPIPAFLTVLYILVIHHFSLLNKSKT